MKRQGLLIGLTLIGLAGCEANGPEMQPGNDCMSCHAHASGGHASFGAAGTVFTDGSGKTGLAGATIDITDANAVHVTLTSNAVGNFFTREPLATPFQKVTVTHDGHTQEMPSSNPATSGSCNSCHTDGGAANAFVFAP